MACNAVSPLGMARRRISIRGKLLHFFTRLLPAGGKLDLDATPDRVKRDLGFLDGRDPRYRDPWLR
ncbi:MULTISPECIES: hypothetical protein [Rhizobium]|uniref:DUF1127 domain-containing protein n=1 Tax=Rhizobium rhododendri TaxID=2506430 RepID=A0ABY8IEF6_9HYPH|nr:MULTISPECIES: hypothetical protein [Rhizobium]MBZ5758767.1 hypothetical protein [Rhizobium sp. VS19-DR96]MBZ5764403.1 hypothetical protein [Rhizobium sp. VS19-DR129.2]MBZ5771946.1 hypothetical protein [Rhizobium sp. VS19-DRK62.2]MBZ5783367.1 hypothetical protein [Rhizobium sp. VS19-DR121]MBZ5800815.1 hypothetical protein [Rhizobium sp. VS19-DR181]